jgi:NAD+ kinase
MVSVIGSFLWVALLALSWLSNDVNSFVAHMSYPRSFVSSPLWLAKKNPTNDDAAGLPPPPANSSAMVLPDLYSTKSLSPSTAEDRRKMNLMWCTPDYCKDVVRERVGKHNQIVLNGPATGQVAYKWGKYTSGSTSTASVLMLVKPGNEDLMEIAANAVSELLEKGGIQVLLHPEVAAKLTHYYGVRDEGISLFEPKLPPDLKRDQNGELIPGETYTNSQPDLIVTLGGDGLLMHASMLFQGAVPPIISIAGGSLGFLTPFSKEEMVDAIQVALGVVQDRDADDEDQQIFPPNMPSYPYEPLIQPPHALNSDVPKFSFGLGDAICLSIRMRLDCRILNKEGTVTARFNVLNEVVIDRGSSPYLANLECFVDDLHLTTVQADGIVFAT